MSWFKQNYEKAALGGAAIIAIGLVYAGWTQLNSVEENFSFTLKGNGNNDPSVKDADLIPKAVSSLNSKRAITQAEDGERPVDLFVGIPLFVSSNSPDKPVDLVEGEPVHPPIPNTWWLQNRLDPGFGDSPARDPDADGFSNLEEFNGKTDPNNASSHPSLLGKLKYLKDESFVWVLRPGFETEGGFTFKYEDSKRQANSAGATAVVMPGALFFASGAAKERFKLLGSEKRSEFNQKIGVPREVTYVKVEDQLPNKKGMVYEFPAPLGEDRKSDHLKYDRTAVFSLEALGLSGKQFKVEERTAFALPADSKEKSFFTKEVKPDSVVIEYTDADGTKKTVTIPKGGFAASER